MEMEDSSLEEERQFTGNCRKVVWEQCLGGNGNFYNKPQNGVFDTGYI